MPLDSYSAPDPVTPHDTPSSPSDYAGVTPHGQGPAPYNIQANQADLSGMVSAAGALTGTGVVYPQGPRQSAAETLLQSPPGYGEQDIDAGFAADWPNNVKPGG
jgi:hypothetical protein